MTMRPAPIQSPALRYHGAKFREAPWYLEMFPQHTCYVEEYGGAAGVLLQKPRSYAEVYNDLDGDIVNFFRVLQDPVTRQALVDGLAFTPYSRKEFEKAFEPCSNEIESARRLCVRSQMGFGSTGANGGKGNTGFCSDTKREYRTIQHIWAEYPEIVQLVGLRFQGILIEQRPALEVMAMHDAPDTLHFIDPPYLASTRDKRLGEPNRRRYKFEMTVEQHETLLKASLDIQGYAILCGYDNELYNDVLRTWHRVEKMARVSAGRGTGVRKEIAWINPAAWQARNQQLF